jgi:mono/diheme cytochrome c family protein
MKKLFAAVMVLSCLSAVAWADSAEDIWTAKCKSCHGADGKANTKEGKKQKIDDMSKPDWQAHNSDADMKKIITEGSEKKDSKMKAFKDKLSAAEIDSLVAYIRTLKAK